MRHTKFTCQVHYHSIIFSQHRTLMEPSRRCTSYVHLERIFWRPQLKVVPLHHAALLRNATRELKLWHVRIRGVRKHAADTDSGTQSPVGVPSVISQRLSRRSHTNSPCSPCLQADPTSLVRLLHRTLSQWTRRPGKRPKRNLCCHSSFYIKQDVGIFVGVQLSVDACSLPRGIANQPEYLNVLKEFHQIAAHLRSPWY